MTSQPNIIVATALNDTLSTTSLSFDLTDFLTLLPIYTPNTVNWGTLNYDGVDWQAQSQQFTGINRSIVVRATLITTPRKTQCYFKQGSSDLTGLYAVASNPEANGYTLIDRSTPVNITISPNDWLTFAAFINTGFAGTQTCTVTNQTTGGNTLDTFDLTTNMTPP